uniref:MHC class I-like antigen recognition-like domain-containing protein n=1 Tax=Astyanax mexicanus TaxID=7994 RepID=A0A8B9GZ80_ASTMX
MLILSLLFSHKVTCLFYLFSSGVHFHQATFIYTTRTTILPKCMATTFTDGLQISYYDSNSKTFKSSWGWVRESMNKSWELFKNSIYRSMEDLNMTSTLLWSTLEIFQWISNCTWDDKSGDCSGYEKYGRNGKDFITLDVKKRSYISHTPEAIHITDLWNKDKARLESVIHHYTSACAELVKISVPKFYGRSSLVLLPPEVYLWQKNSSVVCLATGVYSKTTKVMWQKNSEDIHENVDEGETLCNEVKPEEWKNHQYSCVVFDQNWKDKIVKNLTEEEIKKVILIRVVCNLLFAERDNKGHICGSLFPSSPFYLFCFLY